MTAFAKDSWKRALASLEAAKHLVAIDPDSAASRAYYAAFHAVTAHFALRDITFAKHTQLRAAVHRDLVKAGVWEIDLGRDFDYLIDLRELGDYGGKYHVSEMDAKSAIQKAQRIVEISRSFGGQELDG